MKHLANELVVHNRLSISIVADNPGYCPTVDPQMCRGDQYDSCFDDASCDVSEKCCHDGCRKLCMKPLPKPNADSPREAMSRK